MSFDLASLAALPAELAFDRWLEIPGEWVEAPNIRRGGESGVKRIHSDSGQLLYRKQQVGHIYRSLRHPLGYPTAMRERDALQAAAALGVPVPRLVFAACRKVAGEWQALLVTEALEGYVSLEDCYARGEPQRWGEALHQRILQQVGAVVGRLNRGGWQHGCLYLKHVFVRLQGEQIEVALLDMEKSRKRLLARRAARHDLRQLKRRSSWSEAQWQAFVYGYEKAFGSAIKGLQS